MVHIHPREHLATWLVLSLLGCSAAVEPAPITAATPTDTATPAEVPEAITDTLDLTDEYATVYLTIADTGNDYRYLDRLMYALAVPLQAEFPDLTLTIIGDGPEREELSRLAESARVVFAGVVPSGEIRGWLTGTLSALARQARPPSSGASHTSSSAVKATNSPCRWGNRR